MTFQVVSNLSYNFDVLLVSVNLASSSMYYTSEIQSYTSEIYGVLITVSIYILQGVVAMIWEVYTQSVIT